MKKDRRNIIIFVIVIIFSIALSIFIYKMDFIEKLQGNINKQVVISDYPVIYNVINSSGSNIVNSDVVVSVNASSYYEINKLEYSFDMKKWNNVKIDASKDISKKIVFNKDMNTPLYIRVKNKFGLSSYVYKTYIKIDKTAPIVIYENNKISIRDNSIIARVQYSGDNINWINVLTNKSEYENVRCEYKYFRAVDAAGNISEIIECTNN